MWQAHIPGLSSLRRRQGSALWYRLRTWTIPWMLVLKIVMRRAMLLHGMRFT